jgi:soluble lytic murein transglycosylase-like protein
MFNIAASLQALRRVTVMATLGCALGAEANCFEEAAQLHRVPADLLQAVAKVESSGKASAINWRSAKDHDIGLMQINSGHLGRLARFGITEKMLLDGCVSAHVGAWILNDLFQRKGRTWDAVGAYNAACTKLTGAACSQARGNYIAKVQKALSAINGNERKPDRPPETPVPLDKGLVAVEFESDPGQSGQGTDSSLMP